MNILIKIRELTNLTNSEKRTCELYFSEPEKNITV